MQITPEILNSNWNPHKVELLRQDGRLFKLYGRQIQGINIKKELDEELLKIKMPCCEVENVRKQT